MEAPCERQRALTPSVIIVLEHLSFSRAVSAFLLPEQLKPKVNKNKLLKYFMQNIYLHCLKLQNLTESLL